MEAVYTPESQNSLGEVVVGFDPITAAWHLVQPHMLLAADPAGRTFSGPPSRIADVKFVQGSKPLDRDDLDEYAGQPMLADILRNGKDRYNVKRLDGGGFLVSTAGPRGRRTLELQSITASYRDQFPLGLWELFLDEEGTPLRILRTWADKEESVVFQWSKRPPKPWLLAETARTFRLASFTVDGDSKMFDISAVASTGLDSVLRIKEAEAFLVKQSIEKQGISTDKTKPGTLDQPTSSPRWATWLVISSVVFAAIAGVFSLVRRYRFRDSAKS